MPQPTTETELEPGDWCVLKPKPGVKTGHPATFPVKLIRKGAVGIPEAWWADDQGGRRLWWLESELQKVD